MVRHGDVATMDPDGYLSIKDRSKDIIKSGGEWISSVDLENIAIAHPELADAAVIGARHEKWDERPILVAVAAAGESPSEARNTGQILTVRQNRQMAGPGCVWCSRMRCHAMRRAKFSNGICVMRLAMC